MLRFNEAFWRWFGDSKVVDENGEPLVVYHGTRTRLPFSEFAPFSHFGTLETANVRAGTGGYGSWAKGPRLYPVYLSIQNPKRVLDQYKHISWDDAIEQAIEEGHDGLVYLNMAEGYGTDSWVAFSPTQIKSIYNVGTWDPEDPDIRRNPPKPRRVGSATVTRGANFADDGLYDVVIGDQHYRMFRSPDNGWWYEELRGRHYTECWLGFSMKEAVAKLESRNPDIRRNPAKAALILVHTDSLAALKEFRGYSEAQELRDRMAAEAKDPRWSEVVVVHQGWNTSYTGSLLPLATKVIEFDEDRHDWDKFVRKLARFLQQKGIRDVTVGGLWYDPEDESGCVNATIDGLRETGLFGTVQTEEWIIGSEE